MPEHLVVVVILLKYWLERARCPKLSISWWKLLQCDDLGLKKSSINLDVLWWHDFVSSLAIGTSYRKACGINTSLLSIIAHDATLSKFQNIALNTCHVSPVCSPSEIVGWFRIILDLVLWAPLCKIKSQAEAFFISFYFISVISNFHCSYRFICRLTFKMCNMHQTDLYIYGSWVHDNKIVASLL